MVASLVTTNGPPRCRPSTTRRSGATSFGQSQPERPKPAPLTSCAVMPACAKASDIASESTLNRPSYPTDSWFPGPDSPKPRTSPAAFAPSAWLFVPPTSTPRKYALIPPATPHPGKTGADSAGWSPACRSTRPPPDRQMGQVDGPVAPDRRRYGRHAPPPQPSAIRKP